MELQNFISSTIEQVARGILGASTALADTDAIVSPEHVIVNSENSQAYGRARIDGQVPAANQGTRVVEKIEFDVAVTVEENATTNVGAKISVFSMGIGAGGETDSKTGSVTRVKFAVPVVLPTKPTENTQ